jgi:hypothetical protein
MDALARMLLCVAGAVGRMPRRKLITMPSFRVAAGLLLGCCLVACGESSSSSGTIESGRAGTAGTTGEVSTGGTPSAGAGGDRSTPQGTGGSGKGGSGTGGLGTGGSGAGGAHAGAGGVEVEPDSCPEDVPDDGSACSGDTYCYFDIEGECPETCDAFVEATCEGGQWSLAGDACECPGG